MHAQQGYVFGHVGLCMCAYVYKMGCLGSYSWKISHYSVIYCSLLKYNGQKKAYYAR